MQPNAHLSIADIGAKPYLDSTAERHNGKDYAWLIEALYNKDKKKRKSRKEICEDMGISPMTLSKYILIIQAEKRNGRR